MTAKATNHNTSAGKEYTCTAVHNRNSRSVMAAVTAIASGSAVYEYWRTIIRAVANESSSTTLSNVTATATGSGYTDAIGVLNTGASPLLVNVTAVASGASRNHAVRNVDGAATIRHSVIRAIGDRGECIGMRHMASSGNWVVRVDNSLIEGTGNAFFGDTEYTTYVAHSQFIGFVSANMGAIKCIGAYNENYDPISCS